MVKSRSIAVRCTVVVTAACLAGPAAVGGGSAAASPVDPGSPVTTRVSMSSVGVQGNKLSGIYSDISADGRYVVFTSKASNLVPGDTNGDWDVFVRDRRTNATSRVSVATDGSQANRPSYVAVISADGRYVAFTSEASNLIGWDNNGAADVFVHDRVTKVTKRVSIGRGLQGNSDSSEPTISAHGRYVAFTSEASNLVAGDTNHASDVFLRDRVAQVTRRVSVGPDGTEAPGLRDSSQSAISTDGRYIAFSSTASNLVAGDTNRSGDVFVHDRVTEVTRRVSVGADHAEANSESNMPAISAHGRYVAFSSFASNLVAGDTNRVFDVFVRDRGAKVTQRVSLATGGGEGSDVSWRPAISVHGRFVAFESAAPNLVAGDANNVMDVFLRDRGTKVTQQISLASGGAQGNSESNMPAISAHGRYVGFASFASNLVAGDSNDAWDVFVRNRGTNKSTAGGRADAQRPRWEAVIS